MKGNVLIVDDDAELRSMLRAFFKREFEVSDADSGSAVQKMLDREQPDVVLLAVKLPDADGLDLLPQLKKRWPETEVIVLTGFDDVAAAVEALKRGAYMFVTKPFDNHKLLCGVKCALERKQGNEGTWPYCGLGKRDERRVSRVPPENRKSPRGRKGAGARREG